MIVDKLKDTLNGGYQGLYDEVVTEDCYRLKSLKFVPDVILDIGANVGVFARYARSLFPEAWIISLEPDPENAAHYRKFTYTRQEDKISYRRLILVEKALGKGPLYHGLTARNGSGETYLSAGLGYPAAGMEKEVFSGGSLERSGIPVVALWELVQTFGRENGKHLIKIDCEGAENSIWSDTRNMAVLAMMEYIAAEIHFYALNSEEHPKVLRQTANALDLLKRTHHVDLQGVHLWAAKR